MKYKVVKIVIDKYSLDAKRNGHELSVLVPVREKKHRKLPNAPKWFTEFVDKQFKPFTTKIEADVASLKIDVADLKVRVTKLETKLDTVIKLNNLKIE